MLNLSLCESRHPMPEEVTGSIFGFELNPLDLQGMFKTAIRVLSSFEDQQLNLYVTGLTVALVETLKAAEELGVSVTLMHYNRDTDTYYPQVVSSFTSCPFCGERIRTDSYYCSYCGSN